jgi:hypothetical protein
MNRKDVERRMKKTHWLTDGMVDFTVGKMLSNRGRENFN